MRGPSACPSRLPAFCVRLILALELIPTLTLSPTIECVVNQMLGRGPGRGLASRGEPDAAQQEVGEIRAQIQPPVGRVRWQRPLQGRVLHQRLRKDGLELIRSCTTPDNIEAQLTPAFDGFHDAFGRGRREAALDDVP